MENLCNSFALCIGCPSGHLNQDNKEIHRDNHVLVAKKCYHVSGLLQYWLSYVHTKRSKGCKEGILRRRGDTGVRS